MAFSTASFMRSSSPRPRLIARSRSSFNRRVIVVVEGGGEPAVDLEVVEDDEDWESIHVSPPLDDRGSRWSASGLPVRRGPTFRSLRQSHSIKPGRMAASGGSRCDADGVEIWCAWLQSQVAGSGPMYLPSWPRIRGHPRLQHRELKGSEVSKPSGKRWDSSWSSHW